MEKFFASTEEIDTLAREMPEPREPVVQAMVILDEARRERISYDEAMVPVRAVDPRECDPDLYLLMLCVWAEAANNVRRYQEVRALTARVRSLVSRRTPPALKVTAMITEAMRINVGGNLAAREELLRKTLEVMPRSSPRYRMLLLNYCWSFVTQGRAAEVTGRMAEARRHPELAAMIRMIDLVGCVETGQVAEAERIVAELGSPWSPVWGTLRMARQRGAYRFVRGVLAFMSGTHSLEAVYDALCLRDPANPEYRGPEVDLDKLPRWVWVFHHLLGGRPEEALRQARTEVEEFGEAYVRETGLVPFNLIRCELACRHAEAARHLLAGRRDMGNTNYLDDLFLARAELLDGRRGEAARRFAAALRSAERYGARGRVDFELRLACDMSPADLAWLGLSAGGVPAGAAPAGSGEGAPAPASSGSGRLVGASPELDEVRSRVAQFAALDVPVLIRGETGVGKELVARALHEDGPRAAEPFLAVNCGAIAESLLESELFGHEKGAFTGAERARRGIFEEAGGGTVLLDEIGEVSPRLQVMLLRVLESAEIRPVGSSSSRKISCRILAATNAELEGLIGSRRFREDLLFRLKRLEVTVPPLRDRLADILPLAEHFLAEGRSDGRRPTISAELRAWLLARKWPGNVRELRHFVERLRLLNSEKLEYDLADAGLPREAGGEPAGARSPRQSGDAGREDDARFLAEGRSPLRRRDRLRALFGRHGKLTRKEIAELLRVSTDTATRDLAALVAEGLIERVEPSRSPRSHYFCLRSS